MECLSALLEIPLLMLLFSRCCQVSKCNSYGSDLVVACNSSRRKVMNYSKCYIIMFFNASFPQILLNFFGT